MNNIFNLLRLTFVALKISSQESNGNLASAAPPKKVLNYLANVMKDIARTIEAPVLQECDSNDKTVGQRWVLRAREDWQTVDRIRTTIK